MKRLLGVVPGLVMSLPALADRSDYHDCLLHNLQRTKLDEVTVVVKKACRENYLGPTTAQGEVRAYNECLLQYLEGVESLGAALDIQATCLEKHR